MKLFSSRSIRSVLRRPPRGGRGLKPQTKENRGKKKESPPPRGAWIETGVVTEVAALLLVAPPAGGVD